MQPCDLGAVALDALELLEPPGGDPFLGRARGFGVEAGGQSELGREALDGEIGGGERRWLRVRRALEALEAGRQVAEMTIANQPQVQEDKPLARTASRKSARRMRLSEISRSR